MMSNVSAKNPPPLRRNRNWWSPVCAQDITYAFFGIHVLTPGVMNGLENLLNQADDPRTVTLSSALDQLAGREKYVACEIAGERQNIGIPYGLFYAQLARAMRGVDRETVLTDMVSLLASNGGAR